MMAMVPIEGSGAPIQMGQIVNVGLLFHGVFGLVGRQDIWVGFAHGTCFVVGRRYEGKELIPIVKLGLHG